MKNRIKKYILVAVTGLGAVSCSLEPMQSNNKDNEKQPISSLAELKASLNGSYARMAHTFYYGRDIIAFSESRSGYMYSDERSGRFGNVSGFTILPNQANAKDTWEQIYKVISNTNRVLESDIESSALVDFYKGQAYVIRALAHYDLVRIYGEQNVGGRGMNALGVPYKTKFNGIDEKVSRSSVAENAEAIFSDLAQGIALMSTSKAGVAGEGQQKARINLAAAYGLQSRIALFFSSYDGKYFDLVVSSAELALQEGASMGVMPRSSFLDGYKSDGIMTNSLFELAQSGTDNGGTNSLYNIYMKTATTGYGDLIWIGKTSENFFPSTEDGLLVDDIRSAVVAKDFVGQLRNVGKYTIRTSNIRMLRVEEVMLNYIEATLQGAANGNRGVALDYLNAIVSQRVTLQEPPVDGVVQPAAVAKTYTALDFESYKKERVRELMFEGFAYEDIMRWGGSVTNPKVVSNKEIPSNKVSFGDALTAFPIPQSEINVSKIEQNEAYR